MPGFLIDGSGKGPVGLKAPANTTETRRKHRWAFRTIENAMKSESLLLLKEASRPHPIFQEPILHHNQEQAYFAGKHAWEPIRMMWYDADQPVDTSADIYKWLNTVCDIKTVVVSLPSAYKKKATLSMLDGAGASSETWMMHGCWPQDVNWGGLDYADTEIATIECTMRVDRCTKV